MMPKQQKQKNMTRSEIIKSFQKQINPKGELTNEKITKESAEAIFHMLSFHERKAITYKNRINCDELLFRASSLGSIRLTEKESETYQEMLNLSFEKIEAKIKKLQTLKKNLNK